MAERIVSVEPFDDWVVLSIVNPPDSTDGGLVVPEKARSSLQEVLYKVEKVGSGRLLGSGERRPVKVKVGDTVLLKSSIAVRCPIQRALFWLVPEQDIVARVKTESETS